MINKYISLFLFFLIGCSSYAQNNVFSTKKYNSLCHVWGYLKYYHPKVAEGKYDWDKVLIDKYAQIQGVNDEKALQIFYSQWADELGGFEKCDLTSNVFPKDSTALNWDISWLENANYYDEIFKKDLKCLFFNKKTSKNVYLKPDKDGGPLTFSENTYTSMPYPNESYRLLALFRFWNTIEYFYPYKKYLSKDWDKQIDKFLPLFLEAKNENEYKKAITKLTLILDDVHSNSYLVWDSYIHKYHAAVRFKYIKGKFIVVALGDDLAKNTDIKVGDIIVAADGKLAEYYGDSISKLAACRYELPKALCIERGFLSHDWPTPIALKIERNGENIDIVLNRTENPVWKYKASRVLYESLVFEDKIGYIGLNNISTKKAKKELESYTAKKFDGIILDIREYPADDHEDLINYLVPKQVKFMYMNGHDLKHSGYWEYTDLFQRGKDNPNYFKGKIVVLTSGYSISYGETLNALFMQCPRVKSIGEPSGGANGNVATLKLPGNYTISFTGLGAFYKNGKPMYNISIPIDFPVSFSIKDIQEGKDVFIEKAIEVIKNEKY